MNRKPLTVVLPVRNEASSVQATISGIRAAGLPDSTEILVVDDGSTDGSGELAAEMGVKVLTRQGKGYGAALMAGFAAAEGRYLAFLDADATYPPETLKVLWEHPARDESLLLADRFSERNRMPAVRKVGNRALSLLASCKMGRRIPDLCSGQRLFPRNWLEHFDGLPDGLDFSPAMTLRALRRGLPVAWVKTAYEERAGCSKLSLFKDGPRFLREVLRA